MANGIIIKTPYIEKIGDLVRYHVTIIENGTEHDLFAEVEDTYGEYLSTERLDGLVYLVLPVALREGYDVICEGKVTEQLLHNINEILIPILVIGDEKIHKIKVVAQTDNQKIGGVAVGTAISCGVDSLYTVKKYTETPYLSHKLTHLFITSANAELWSTRDGDLHRWENEHAEAFKRFNRVSEELKLPLVKVYTNFTWYILNRDWKKYHHLYTHHYITMSLVLIFRKLWRLYYFSSTVDFTHFNLSNNSLNDTDKHELLSMHVLGLNDFNCYSGGAEATRIQKTLALTEFPIARETLHPCHKQGGINCSDPTCGKCLRALLTLDYYDKLDTMKNVFDIERYKREKKHYFWQLAARRNDEFLVDLYIMISQKYPSEMEKAVESYERYVKPVAATDYRALQNAYAMISDLLSLDRPKDRVKQYFEDRNIHKLYCSGISNIGNKIIKWLEESVEVVDYKSGKFEDCDMALILATRDNDISSLRAELKKKANKDIISLYELNEILKKDY